VGSGCEMPRGRAESEGDVDITEMEGAAAARDRGIAAACSDARALPVRSGACDLVTAFDVIERVAEDDLVTGEISRLLRPGGVALVAVPCDMDL
jgi:SAM-dependent methyltransferase